MGNRDRTAARRLAAEARARGDAVGWFDALYEQADGQANLVPWADLEVNPNLAGWLEKQPLTEIGKRALVVGCGLGDDAEELAALGFHVTAFDISQHAVAWCRRRFADTRVKYVVADLLNPPAAWHDSFDFVVEAYTLQVLPPELRPQACRGLAECTAPGGTLLVIARGRDASEQPDELPWPLAKDELGPLLKSGMEIASFEDYFDGEDPPVRRFRVEYRRPV